MVLTIHLHKGDLPKEAITSNLVAIDTEAMGLKFTRDRICLVQMSFGDGDAHLVQLDREVHEAPVLEGLLTDPETTKIFHYARFDVGLLQYSFELMTAPLFCTKIASKLVRTYTERHGLKDLCRDLLGVELSKQEQTSDWGAEKLTKQQMEYAANDVLYLHRLKEKLEELLERENRLELAQLCFEFLPVRAHLDIMAGEEFDIFKH